MLINNPLKFCDKGGKLMKKQIITFIAILILAIGSIVGGFLLYRTIITPKAEPTASKNCGTSNHGKTITYKGKNGLTALALLKKKCTTVSSGTGDSSFITSINGVKASKANEFWLYKVNKKSATVGAGSYTTKNSDTIVWELTKL